MLGYLAFLFLPFVLDGGGDHGMNGWNQVVNGRLWLTLLSLVGFLPAYFAAYRATGPRLVAYMLAIAGLCYALLPFNPFANTYLIYAAGFAATTGRALWPRVAWLVALLAGLLAEVLLLGYPMFVFAVTIIIAVAVFVSTHLMGENTRKRAELKLSHDEVRRLAALAERERIGRDLHDLLGHTLSLVALKSELAGKLLERDPTASRREIDDVTRVAREALSQVRGAVSGIRAAGVAAELASAKLLLDCDGVSFQYQRSDLALTPELETVLALTLREAVTNIQRHARARHARVSLVADGNEAVLRIDDDGRGGALVPGNGLVGMRERVESLGGRLRVEAGAGRGTCIEARLPLPVGAPAMPPGTIAPHSP
ncbi:sensor histidine kinase [Lysobacter psychrotolerans]|uniref:Sensor histidine kinase n=2 Tax=Montanilutibacter psychrotolerans TaxID=1327343 RepID=A0A3M8SUL2_9GAMM|nr:sensor histidine kinase [Lysobacter psychrotolerans]